MSLLTQSAESIHATISQMVAYGLSNKASDWHFQQGRPLALSIFKEIIKCDGLSGRPNFPVTPEIIEAILVNHAKADLVAAYRTQPRLALDCAARIEGARFRLHFHLETSPDGDEITALNLRHITDKMPVMEELGLPLGFINFIKNPPTSGLFIVTGATGHGKSTTLAAGINYLNLTFPKKIVTIEAPIEFIHKPAKAIVVQRSCGLSVPDFMLGIEQGLRETPDVIMIGELRDPATISAAFTAASTGHLVFATLHTSNAPGTISRILGAVPEGDRGQFRTALADCLKGVIAQKLVRRIGGGLVGAYEFMLTTTAIAAQIRSDKVEQIRGSISSGQEQHMITLNQSLKKLVKDKAITKELALEHSDHRSELEAELKGV